MICKRDLCCLIVVIITITYVDSTALHKRQTTIDSGACSPPNNFEFGLVYDVWGEEEYIAGYPIPNNSILNIICFEDYKKLPDVLVACIDGSWNDSIPVCVPEGSINEAKDENNEDNSCGYWERGYQAPWHVGLYRKKEGDYQYLCGGSIVSSNVVLTAAHCFTDNNNKKIKPENLYIGAGKTRVEYDSPYDWTSQYVQAKKFVMSEKYKGAQSNLEGDLGLIILNKPFDLGFYVHPVCIDWENKFESQQLAPGNIGYVQGWGYSDLDLRTPSETLQQLGVPFVDKSLCLETVPSSFHKYVIGDKFCAGYTNGSCICNGDDGGGLVYEKNENGQNKYYIRGLVSSFPQTNGVCDVHQYAVYTKISNYKNLIQQVVNENKVKKSNK